MTVPYTFANAVGLVPASELDVNFAYVSNNVSTANTVVFNAQPNITSVGILTSLSTSGNVTGGNIHTDGVVSATGNVTGGNILTTGQVSAVANITANNGMFTTIVNTASFTGSIASLSGNVTGGNILAIGVVSAIANIVAGN